MLGRNISGRICLDYRTEVSLFDPGTLVLTPPDTPYSVRYAGAGEPWIAEWIIFNPSEDWLKDMFLPPITSRYMGLNLCGTPYESKVQKAFKEVREWMAHQHLETQQLAVNTIERILLLGREAAREQSAPRIDERIAAIRNFLAECFAEEHSVESLAAQVHISPSHFAELFRKEVGITPMRYLEQLRIERAKELLLTTGLPVQEIAIRLGYHNPYHFSTRFHRCTGQSPRQYRLMPKNALG